MGGNYEKSTFNQLMEVMAKLGAMEAEHKMDRKEIKNLIVGGTMRSLPWAWNRMRIQKAGKLLVVFG